MNISVKFLKALLGVLLIGLLVQSARGAATEATLVLAADSARPGDTVMAGVHLRMKPHWHTYWRNPGGSGMATKIVWQLPPGVSAGETQWPVPEKLPADDLTTFVYEKGVVLLIPLKIAADAAIGPAEIKAKVSWLECDTQCVLGSGDVEAKLTIGNETKPSTNANLIALWQAKLPATKLDLDARAWWEKPSTNDLRPLILEWPATAADQESDFYPYASDKFEMQLTNEFLHTEAGKNRLRKMVKKFEGDWPDKISGLLIQTSDDKTLACELNLPVALSDTTTAPATTAIRDNSANSAAMSGGHSSEKSFGLMLLYAFLGGLVLNVMPCVLPVIALKILGFVNQGREHPGRVRTLGFVYAGGVLFSFLVLAGLVCAVKLAGHHAAWGLQFSNPQFLVVMTVLITLVALNLFGVFEVNLSGKVMGAAGELSSKEGNAGAFFNGALATVLATPCSAPYLGTALGFAFTQTYPFIILFFLMVGVGLATPYVILSWNPALLKLLPKPGAWMEKFKIAMGFPMLATAVWLYDLTTVHYGTHVLWLALFLVVVALAAWIYGEFVQRGRNHKGLAVIIMLLILTGGYFYALEDHLQWRSPVGDVASATPQATARTQKTEPDGIDWQPWRPEAVVEARAAGHPILVDFTADWCKICQYNNRHSIDIPSVRQRLKEIHAVTLKADYTKTPENITIELGRFGRGAVPLVLVYPGNPAVDPEVLPDGPLSPTIVLDALNKAAKETPATAISANP